MRSLALVVTLAGAAHADISLPGTRRADARDCDAAGKRVEAVDINGDGKPDVWKVYAGERLVCKRVDLNFDGRVDLQTHYDADGAVRLEEYDFDFDGRFDFWALSEKGRRVCDVVFDTDGKPIVWKRYVDGVAVPEKTPSGACLALAR